MSLSKFTQDYFAGLAEALEKLDYPQMEAIARAIWSAYKKKKTIFFIGNGGSASTATHLAADIGKNAGMRIKTLALTDNVAWITALGNDLSYEDIFVEQLKNFAGRGDLLVVISGSGNSANVVKAAAWAKRNGLVTAALLGFSGGKLMKMVDIPVWVKVDHYGYVEGIHSEIHHYLVEVLKKRFRMR